MKNHARTDGLIGDYCDGSFVKNHEYFRRNINALQLVMYFDEVEACDPLASHKGQHKLGQSNGILDLRIPYCMLYAGLFYYIIANLRPELRSTQRCIQLISVVTSPVLNKYGFGEILKPFVKDVNKLCTVSSFVF